MSKLRNTISGEVSPLLAKAELTKLRFAQLLERTSVMCHRSFVSDRVSFYDGSYRRAEFPFFAKKGWTRPQENAAKLPLIGADGVVVSSYRLSTPTVLISGGLKQLPRLRQQGRRTFSLWRSHPFFAKKTSEVEFQHRSSRFFHSFDQECGQWRPVFEQRFRVNLILIRLSIFPTPK